MSPVDSSEEKKPEPLPSAVEFEPPLACVRRILKHTLPPSTAVGKDASAAFARASGIFIIYLTACANDFARENKRQTITANDVLAAIKELDFDEFTPEMNEFLTSYRASEKTKKDAKLKAKAAAEDAASEKANESDEEDDDDKAPALEAEQPETNAPSPADDAETNGNSVADDAETNAPSVADDGESDVEEREAKRTKVVDEDVAS